MDKHTDVLDISFSTRIGNRFRDYYELCKPRVVMLMILTSMVGMALATPHVVPLSIFILGNVGIALSAGAAAVLNHLVDRRIDAVMLRTQKRPIPQGKISPGRALFFAICLIALSMWILFFYVNVLAAVLTFCSLIGYAGIYTLYLKRATPQNIVIGGAAGAAPPLLGWVCVTGHIAPLALILFLIIFVWTPPHFWALAIHRHEEYAKVNIPMLTTTHGIAYTKRSILLYTLLLCAVTILPFATGMCGWLYLACALVLDGIFLYWSVYLTFSDNKAIPMKTFRYSIWYLMFLFTALLFDHYTSMVKWFH